MTAVLDLQVPVQRRAEVDLTAPAQSSIGVTRTATARVVRLPRRLDAGAVPGLREALLRQAPDGCVETVVEAGAVEYADDAALAVLLAAPQWAAETGGRLTVADVSAVLASELAALGFGTDVRGPGR